MSYTATTDNISQYSQVRSYSGVTDAHPHRLVQMLLEGALGKIAAAKGYISRGEVARKGETIGHAIAIVGGLRASLNITAGGEVASNLDALYEYMEHRLLAANIDNNTDILDEIAGLLKEIKAGWDAIPEDIRNQNNAEHSGLSGE